MVLNISMLAIPVSVVVNAVIFVEAIVSNIVLSAKNVDLDLNSDLNASRNIVVKALESYKLI